MSERRATYGDGCIEISHESTWFAETFCADGCPLGEGFDGGVEVHLRMSSRH